VCADVCVPVAKVLWWLLHDGVAEEMVKGVLSEERHSMGGGGGGVAVDGGVLVGVGVGQDPVYGAGPRADRAEERVLVPLLCAAFVFVVVLLVFERHRHERCLL
jgi:hypothetical protein